MVRPVRPDGHGQGWAELEARQQQITGWVAGGVPVVKIGVLLARQGVVVAERTLHRFAAERCGGKKVTTPVDDGPPGSELQIDFDRRAAERRMGVGRARLRVPALLMSDGGLGEAAATPGYCIRREAPTRPPTRGLPQCTIRDNAILSAAMRSGAVASRQKGQCDGHRPRDCSCVTAAAAPSRLVQA